MLRLVCHNESRPMHTPAENRFTVTIEPAQLRFTAPAGVPLLAAAEQARIALPASCRNGTCRTCMCGVIEGQVRYRIEWPGLSAEEKQEGYILPCVAHPLSDLVLHAPGARLLERA